MTNQLWNIGTLALAGLLALGTGCSSKKEEPKTDEDIWAEATGEEPVVEEADDEDEADEASADHEDGEGHDGEDDQDSHDGEHEEGEEHGDDHEEDDESASASPPPPSRVLADGSRLYGAPLADDAPKVSLADVLAHADRYEGQVVRTEGEVARVCQAMGCWMELRGSSAAADGDALRVPMAGHAFFLPKDAAGQRAEVAGRVKVAALDPAQQEHLRSEGARAASQPVSLDATGVVLR